MGHDNLIALVAATVVGAGITTGWTYLSKRTSEYRQSVATLQHRQTNFSSLFPARRKDATTVKTGVDEPVVVFHSSPDRRRFVPRGRDEIAAIVRVFAGNQPPE